MEERIWRHRSTGIHCIQITWKQSWVIKRWGLKCDNCWVLSAFSFNLKFLKENQYALKQDLKKHWDRWKTCFTKKRKERGQRTLYWKIYSTSYEKVTGNRTRNTCRRSNNRSCSWQVCCQGDDVNGEQLWVTNTGPQGRKIPHGWESNLRICCRLLFISLPREVFEKRGWCPC